MGLVHSRAASRTSTSSPNQIQPTMDLEVGQRDSGTERLVSLVWYSSGRSSRRHFFFGMTAQANVRVAWRLSQDLLASAQGVGIQIQDCLSLSTCILVHAQTLDTIQDMAGRDWKTACEPTYMPSSFLGRYVIRGEARGGARVSHRTDSSSNRESRKRRKPKKKKW